MTPPLVKLPTWVVSAVGVLAFAALVLAVAGVAPLPGWAKIGSPFVARHAGPDVMAAAAETTMRRAAGAIYAAKLHAGVAVDRGGLAEDLGLVGSELTPFVTTLGSLEAKRLAASPSWARVLTMELARAGVGPGTVVAASFSGSFPGLNLAVICAAHELGAQVLAATSVTASTWGATEPGFTWPELEVRLVGMGIIPAASVAVSVGGAGDRGLDLEPEARSAARAIAIEAARVLGARFLEPVSYEDAVRLRAAAFDERRRSRPIVVFVNVGGAEASLGRSPAILRMRSGWLDSKAFEGSTDGGLIALMAARGTPVLHLLNVRELGLRWGMR